MTKKQELYDLCEKVNLAIEHHILGDFYLKVEHENDCFYIRLYNGKSCQKTLFGGGTAKEMIESLRAFRKGFLFLGDYNS